MGRLADTSFLWYEGSAKGGRYYQKLLKILENRDECFSASGKSTVTHIEKAANLNDNPLPICWTESQSEHPVLFDD